MLLPCLAAGIALALSLPPWGLWVLAFPAAGVMWWRLGGLGIRGRLMAGWIMGIGMFVPGLWWLTTFNTYGGLVLMALESLAPALACAVVPARARGRTAVLAGGMVLTEAVRATWPFGGLPMGGISLGQASSPLADASRVGGPLLLVGLVWLGGAALAMVVTSTLTGVRRGPAGGGRARSWSTVRPLVCGVAVLVVVAGVAWWGRVAPDGGPAVRTVRVASVQGGGVRGLRKAQVDPATVTAAQFAATRRSRRATVGGLRRSWSGPRTWCRSTTSSTARRQKGDSSALAVSLRATLLVGVTETVSTQSFRNEVVAFAPSGRLVARYEKVHRVPFGEYVPYRGFFKHFADLSSVPLDAIPGHGNGVLHTPVGPLGTLISYEVFDTRTRLASTRARAELLVDPTNTSSYLTSQVPTQEIAAARIQALAEGRDVVQAAPTGFSAVIDSDGRVLARTDLAVRAVIVRDVALRTGRTLYEQGGDLPVLVASGILVVLGWLSAVGADPDLVTTGAARRERRALTQRRSVTRAPLSARDGPQALRRSPWRAATISRMPSRQSTVVGPASSCMRVRSSCTLSMVCSVGSKRASRPVISAR